MSRALHVLYAYGFEFPSESGMAIQILGDGHALATRGIGVTLYVFPSPVHRLRSVEEGLRFYGLAPHPLLRIRRLPFAAKALRKKFAAPAFWAAVVRDLIRLRAARLVVLSRSRKITRRLLALRRLLPLRYAIVQEIHEDGVKGVRPEGTDAREITREIEFFRRVDAVISTSPVVSDHLDRAYGVGDRVRCIPNGANVERFLGIDKRFDGWTTKADYLLAYAGAFTAWKQVSLAIEALRHLPDSVRLLIMGGKLKYRSADRQQLLAVAERLGVADRVVYRGFVAPADLPAELARADILLLPLGDNPVARFFTSPLKLFEYMATGLPIIAPAYPTITPFLTHRVTGLLVDPMTPETIADAVTELIGDAGLAERLGRNARREAPRYSRTRRAERIDELLTGVAGEGRLGPATAGSG